MLHGHVLEVRKLHPRPDHEVLGKARDVSVSEALARGRAFEVGHGGEEEACNMRLVDVLVGIWVGRGQEEEGREGVSAYPYSQAQTPIDRMRRARRWCRLWI